MPDFGSTRLALRLPPVRRIYDALRNLTDRIADLITRQDRFACEIENLTAELREVRETAASALAAALTPKRHGGPAEDSLADRWTEREMQSAALRNMPFLPHDISLQRDGLHLAGYAGAPDALTAPRRSAEAPGGRSFGWPTGSVAMGWSGWPSSASTPSASSS
jgi:hypothetical protein